MVGDTSVWRASEVGTMANTKHLQRLMRGVRSWNAWQEKHPYEIIDLSGSNLRSTDLSGVVLSGANLNWINCSEARLSGADLRGADLMSAVLSKTDLTRARLYKADLTGATIPEASLNGADFRSANLSRAHLRKADLRGANLTGARLYGADLQEANLTGAVLRRADFNSAALSLAVLREVDFRQASLIGAHLDSATLSDAWMWETQRAGWSIQGIICEAAYWDRDRQERTIYNPGEFEHLYADQTKIMLYYEGGMSPIEIATLPALIQRIEATHPGCILRLQSVEEAPGGATVTLVIDDTGARNPDEVRTLKTEIEAVSQRAIRYQRALLEERGRRKQADLKLQMMYDEIFPRIMRLIMEKSQSIQINVSGGTIHGNVVGDVSGDNTEVNYSYNNLATIEALVNEILTHRVELPLIVSERIHLETQLKVIQEQLAAQAPNHSTLREALHSVRHILEAGVAHALVGHWREILHALR
jgi:hypothetical protein